MGSKPDHDILRWALSTYCEKNGDIPATFAALGDNPAEALNKPTYVSLLGLTAARAKAQNLHLQALSALEDFGEQAEPLRQLSGYIISRAH